MHKVRSNIKEDISSQPFMTSVSMFTSRQSIFVVSMIFLKSWAMAFLGIRKLY